jgi:hypothetical protein
MLGYPIFDATLVTVSRFMDGRRLAEGGRDHSSHRLARLGLSARQTAVTIYIIALALTGAAVYLSRLQSGNTSLVVLATLGAAAGLGFLGLRLFRVPVTTAALQTVPGTRRVAVRLPNGEDLSILVPRDRVYSTASRRTRGERSRETVEAR